MKKQELIELLKNADTGSDELNVAYYTWKYPERHCDVWRTYYMDDSPLKRVSNSVDAALGEIPVDYREHYNVVKRLGVYHITMRKEEITLAIKRGSHKSLPVAILLAVVGASI